MTRNLFISLLCGESLEDAELCVTEAESSSFVTQIEPFLCHVIEEPAMDDRGAVSFK